MPWKSFRTPEPGREYVALLSYLPLRSFLAMPKFIRFTLEILDQLRKAGGLIGYTLYAEPLAKRFWTLSAWEDAQALMNFVWRAPHSRIMQDLAPDMGKTQFVQWKVGAADLPLEWADAKARLG
jgi:hypothetical protein